PLGPLRYLPQHQHRRLEARCLFLDAAGIGDHERGCAQRLDEVEVVEWRHEPDARMLGQCSLGRRFHLRVRMHWIYDDDVIMRVGYVANRTECLLQWRPE